MRGTALLALMLSAGAALADDRPVVRLATEAAFAPFNFYDDAGALSGYDIELAEDLCDRAGFNCIWVVHDWDTLIPGLIAGNFDVIVAAMTVTAEREEIIDFGGLTFPPVDSAYVARDPDLDLSTARIAAQSTTEHAAHVMAAGQTLIEFPTPEDTVEAVLKGEADAVFSDWSFLAQHVAQSEGALVVVGDRVAIGQGFAFGFRESDGDLRAAFDRGLAEVKADGSLNAALIRWFGEDAAQF